MHSDLEVEDTNKCTVPPYLSCTERLSTTLCFSFASVDIQDTSIAMVMWTAYVVERGALSLAWILCESCLVGMAIIHKLISMGIVLDLIFETQYPNMISRILVQLTEHNREASLPKIIQILTLWNYKELKKHFLIDYFLLAFIVSICTCSVHLSCRRL